MLLNSITDAGDGAMDQIIICGSHGGMYPAYLASLAGLRAVIFNDAGEGLENAGIAGVLALADVGMAAAAVSHDSCRIGDADDMADRGIISFANDLAASLGVEPGQMVSEAARLLAANDQPRRAMAGVEEARRKLRFDGVECDVILVDSASLVVSGDKGAIVVTGSHGGLIGGDPARALKADAALAVFNDAGGGRDGAGLTRLPALDDRGLAAVTVGHNSARIGDADSTLATGIVSAANPAATALGFMPGEALKTALMSLPVGGPAPRP